MKFYLAATLVSTIFLLSNLAPVKEVSAKPTAHKASAQKLLGQLSLQGKEAIAALLVNANHVVNEVKEVTPEVEQNVGIIFDKFSGADLKLIGESVYCPEPKTRPHVPDTPKCQWFHENKDSITEAELKKQLIGEFITEIKKGIKN